MQRITGFLKKHMLVIMAVFTLLMLSMLALMVLDYAGVVVNPRAKNAWRVDAVSLYEQYEPPVHWQPGKTAGHTVAVLNNGRQAALVRLSLEEYCKINKSAAKPRKVSSQDEKQDGWVAVYFDPKPYASWKQTEAEKLSGTVPEGFVLKQGEIIDYTDNSRKKIFVTYIILQTPDGRESYQKVTADVRESKGKFEIKDIQFWYYDSFESKEMNWLKDAGKQEMVMDWVRMQGTLRSLDTMTLSFGKLSQEITDNNWWYCAQDGYFYWIGALEPGTMTALFCNGVQLQTQAPDDSVVDFNLTLRLDTVLADGRALTAENGWKLPTDSEIYKRLSLFCKRDD